MTEKKQKEKRVKVGRERKGEQGRGGRGKRITKDKQVTRDIEVFPRLFRKQV